MEVFMKAKLVCFKLSKIMCVLGMIVLFEIGFILVQVNELREYRSFKQIQENMNITKQMTKKEAKPIEENSNQMNTTKSTNKASQNVLKKEYETMPQTLKGYKVIRKNNHSKTIFRYLYFRRNHNKIIKSIGNQTIWTKYQPSRKFLYCGAQLQE